MRRWGVIATCALVVLMGSSHAGAASTAPCTTAQKAKAQQAFAAYKARAPRERASYFRTHQSVALRKDFVRRQQAKLKALQLAAACTVPPATPPPPAPQPPAPQPPAPPPVAAAEYTFGPGVTQQLADEVRAGTDRAVAYFTKIGAVPPSIRMRGYADAESTAQAYAAALNTPVDMARNIWASSTAVSTRAGIFINLGATFWRDTTPALRAKVIAHELFHLTQEALAGSRWTFGPPETIPGGGPRWLIEGSAELMGFLAVADSGMLPFEQARSEQVATSKYADSVPLATWANLIGINEHPKAAYNVFFVAAEYLTRDRGRQSLLEFWRAIGAGQSWEAAFATAFGRTPEAFYSDFENYRRTL